jgi:hypothetical protein
MLPWSFDNAHATLSGLGASLVVVGGGGIYLGILFESGKKSNISH